MKQDLAIDAVRFAKLHARLLAIALARHHAKDSMNSIIAYSQVWRLLQYILVNLSIV